MPIRPGVVPGGSMGAACMAYVECLGFGMLKHVFTLNRPSQVGHSGWLHESSGSFGATLLYLLVAWIPERVQKWEKGFKRFQRKCSWVKRFLLLIHSCSFALLEDPGHPTSPSSSTGSKAAACVPTVPAPTAPGSCRVVPRPKARPAPWVSFRATSFVPRAPKGRKEAKWRTGFRGEARSQVVNISPSVGHLGVTVRTTESHVPLASCLLLATGSRFVWSSL